MQQPKVVDRVADWIRGDDAVMYKQVPAAIGKMHVTELMGRHPYHPFNPELKREHPCAQMNADFFQCMDYVPRKDDPEELHQRHVRCYHPYKRQLMKCLVTAKKADRAAAEALAEAEGGEAKSA